MKLSDKNHWKIQKYSKNITERIIVLNTHIFTQILEMYDNDAECSK